MIQTVKMSEQMRKEYRILPAVIMDAIDEGEARGKSLGLAEGKILGLAEGSRQKALETAAAFKRFGFDIDKIAEGTGLSREEIEKL